MNGKTIRNGVILLCAAAVMLTAGCKSPTTAREYIPVVRTMTVGPGAAAAAIYAGDVRGRYESQLAFQVGGKVTRRNVDLGSVVRAGDVLMTIDTRDIRQGVNIGAAQVAAAETQLKLAEANLKRYRMLYEQAAISQAEYDQYKTAYDAAAASLKQARAQYAQSANALGYSELKADADGVISSVLAEVGQVVSAGQAVVTLVKEGELEVEINAPENRVQELHPHSPVTVSFWALDGVVIPGAVREISPAADPTTRTYKVRISLPNPPAAVKLGMTASVAVPQPNGAGARAFYIPLTAIYQTGAQPAVWLVKDGAARLQTVAVEQFGDNQVAVTDGLKEGDVIVTAGVHKLREGQKVQPAEGDAP